MCQIRHIKFSPFEMFLLWILQVSSIMHLIIKKPLVWVNIVLEDTLFSVFHAVQSIKRFEYICKRIKEIFFVLNHEGGMSKRQECWKDPEGSIDSITEILVLSVAQLSLALFKLFSLVVGGGVWWLSNACTCMNSYLKSPTSDRYKCLWQPCANLNFNGFYFPSSKSCFWKTINYCVDLCPN